MKSAPGVRLNNKKSSNKRLQVSDGLVLAAATCIMDEVGDSPDRQKEDSLHLHLTIFAKRDNCEWLINGRRLLYCIRDQERSIPAKTEWKYKEKSTKCDICRNKEKQSTALMHS